MKYIGITVTIVAASALSAFLNGLTFQVLWAWFVVPQFHVAPLSIPVALGLATIVLTKQYDAYETDRSKTKKASERYIKMYSYQFVWPLMALLCGAIYHAFM